MQPLEIVQKMMNHDGFSQWMGIEVLIVEKGYCKIKMKINSDMLNGFGVAHGGIAFSFADSCFAFASNSHGLHAVSIHTSIQHFRPVFEGDILIAESYEEHLGKSSAGYSITVTNQHQKKVAFFSGTVFRKAEEWKP